MRALLDEVLALQPSWSHRNTVEMQRRGVVIRKEIPDWLLAHRQMLSHELGTAGADINVEGRDGTGQKSEIPWVRIFSESRSPSANEGWYCVYLFRSDGSGVYLCLGQASTRYQEGDFKPRSPAELSGLVAWAHGVLGARLTGVSGLAPSITLHSRGKLGPAYEQSTVCSKLYEFGSMPTEEKLLLDLKQFLSLLRVIYDADDLGRSPENKQPELRAAQELAISIASPLKARAGAGQGFGLTAKERRAVERRAMDVAQAYLIAEGYEVEDVSSKRSYDFVARRTGQSIIVEVKGTTGGLGSIVLTTNEIAAHKASHPENALIIVHSIDLDRKEDNPHARGGILHAIQPWLIDPSALQPLSFQYKLPAAD